MLPVRCRPGWGVTLTLPLSELLSRYRKGEAIMLFRVFMVAVLFTACAGDDGDPNDPGDEVIGVTTLEIDARDEVLRTGETGIGNLVTDLLKSGLESLGHTVDIGLFNAGAIRGKDDPNGPVYAAGSNLTANTLDTLLRFSNDHEIVTISGTQLKSVLERGVRSLPIDLESEDRGGQFALLSGARYEVTCDGTRQTLDAAGEAVETEGTRITMIEVGGTVIYDADGGVDTLDTVSYTVAASAFVTQGKDGHLALAEPTGADRVVVPQADFHLVDALHGYVADNTPISLTVDDPPRITFVGDCNRAL